jgi:periplasmic divalent cation tolerance protein
MRVLLCTVSPEQAPGLARRLLEEKLVGCANILSGVRSLYWWEGAIQDEGEALLIMETPATRADEAMRRLAELHPYSVPKILAIEPSAVHEPYRVWLAGVTGS